ncbi:uncharacterized protein FFB14_15646 [Fusarium fujikuroi]|nr:uncharacterized protein FFB14_15646 [Fusarium fujikuroi]
MARQDALNQQLQAVSEMDSSLRMIVNLLRGSSKDESVKLLDNIREAQSIDEFVQTFGDACLLLPRNQQASDT